MGPSDSPITCPTCGTENTPHARYCTNCGVAVGSQPAEASKTSGDVEYSLHRCSFHPDVETGLACGKCGQNICPRCMIQTPVGSRCRDCAQVTRLPTFDVSTSYLVRASSAAVVIGVVTAIVWNLIVNATGIYVGSVLTIGAGYLVGEAISLAANRKRGRSLAIIAGISMTIFAVLSGLLFSIFSIFGIISLVFAYYIAVNRVR